MPMNLPVGYHPGSSRNVNRPLPQCSEPCSRQLWTSQGANKVMKPSQQDRLCPQTSMVISSCAVHEQHSGLLVFSTPTTRHRSEVVRARTRKLHLVNHFNTPTHFFCDHAIHYFNTSATQPGSFSSSRIRTRFSPCPPPPAQGSD